MTARQIPHGAYEKLEGKIKKTPTCWEWLGWKDKRGYGYLFYEGKNYRAHRVSFSAHKGSVATHLVIDHLCRNTSCVNPQHLEAVSSKINTLRGIGITAQNASKTHCVRGHELKLDRECKICKAIRWRKVRPPHKTSNTKEKYIYSRYEGRFQVIVSTPTKTNYVGSFPSLDLAIKARDKFIRSHSHKGRKVQYPYAAISQQERQLEDYFKE